MKRFEAPGRFWEVDFENDTFVRITFGKQGTAGNRVERQFPTPAAAREYVEQQIKRQLAQGYVPVAGPTVEAHDRRERYEWVDSATEVYHFRIIEQTTLRVAVRGGEVEGGVDQDDPESVFIWHHRKREEADTRFDDEVGNVRYTGAERVAEPAYTWHGEPALEAQCDESPNAAGPWEVYADWLMSHGDLRGELASLANANRDADVAALLAKHRYGLLGTDFANIEVEMRHGFVAGATIRVIDESHEGIDAATRMFLASPLGRFVESLRFGLASTWRNDWETTINAIAESRRAGAIKRLAFDAFAAAADTRYGDLSTAWPKLSALEELRIVAGGEGNLGALALPRLRTLVFEGGGDGELRSIVDGALPSLEVLVLRGFPAAATVEALAVSKLLPKLRVLRLIACNLGRAGCEALLAAAAKLVHLEIDLGENYLTVDEVAKLAAKLPNLRAENQRVRDGAEAPPPEPPPDDDDDDDDQNPPAPAPVNDGDDDDADDDADDDDDDIDDDDYYDDVRE